MAIPVLPLALLVPLVVAVSDTVPVWNYEPSCRGGMDAGSNQSQRLQKCLGEEAAARTKLQASWTQYPAKDRTVCADTAKLGTPSYVELLTCLELARDAAKMPKN